MHNANSSKQYSGDSSPNHDICSLVMTYVWQQPAQACKPIWEQKSGPIPDSLLHCDMQHRAAAGPGSSPASPQLTERPCQKPAHNNAHTRPQGTPLSCTMPLSGQLTMCEVASRGPTRLGRRAAQEARWRGAAWAAQSGEVAWRSHSSSSPARRGESASQTWR
jgi:hypothetical protein